MTREELQQIVSAARSYSELSKRLGAHIATIKRHITKLSIDVTHFKHCQFCDAKFDNTQAVFAHVLACKQNPARHEIRKRRTLKQRGRPLAAATCAKISATANAKIAAGTWHNSFAKRRKHTYHNVTFDGTWELKFAQWCDAHAVQWQRNVRSFSYHYGCARKYTPDFYLPSADCYIEIKGWAVDKDRAKWSQFPERLLILRGEDLQALGIDVEVKKQHIHR